jgi:hypothetical protein
MYQELINLGLAVKAELESKGFTTESADFIVIARKEVMSEWKSFENGYPCMTTKSFHLYFTRDHVEIDEILSPTNNPVQRGSFEYCNPAFPENIYAICDG